MKDLNQESSLKILFLLNLLYDKELSKNQIIEEYKKKNVEIKKPTINSYIEKLKSHGFKILTKKVKNINYYSLDKKYNTKILQKELDASSDVKKLLLAEKNEEIIRSAMRVFYKFALHTDDEDARLELINFGYYSKINWLLVNQLKEHCKNKNIIMLNYIMPDGKNKNITIHADEVKIGDWSDRLYLSGILENDKKISQLPIDKIFMIKKVIKENVKINLEIKVLTYKVSEETYKKAGLDKKEGLSEVKNKIATIRRPLDDTFFTMQRLLYFCPDLYYVSDENLKNAIKEKLYSLKEMYNEEFDK